MKNIQQITFGTFAGSVSFKGRAFGVNSYDLSTRDGLAAEVRVNDDGSLYHAENNFPWAVSVVLAVVGEYERRAWSDFLEWAQAGGYSTQGQKPHVLAYPNEMVPTA